ncbi:phage tail terminator protein [Companilactobacillus mishanensis]|uniref:Minor capsid protein n=1 Tax=Companilactobacillus mishanensis TaxID=2486008 RepID=A0A5P0ZF30_9LACO|nr:minor capsid protein [Companilactobacillus mishanensis]MQS44244.1 minor capsid protein [Companilactobacillus mishanensis]MQS51652.1 minor capsid protein [Companilactobacillus mishanensis]
MDLIDRLAESLNKIQDLPSKVIKGYMQPDETIGLYPLPGSSLIDEDWAGNRTKRMNYEVAIRTNDSKLANDSMWLISNYLESLKDIKSKDNSYQFEQIQQTGLPSISEQDDRGFSVYMLDFFIDIITLRK